MPTSPPYFRTAGRPADGFVVRFAEPEIGISPGQACVIYDGATGSRVLGGGFIRRSP